MSFDEFVEKLGSPLIQITELSALVVVELNIGVICQHFADEQARPGVRHLSPLIGGLNEALRTIDIDRSGRSSQRTKEPTTQNGCEFRSQRNGFVLYH